MSVSFTKIHMSLSRSLWEQKRRTHTLPKNLIITPISQPSYKNYICLAEIVGSPYGWTSRKRIQDQSLMENLLHTPGALFFLFQKKGKDIGYCFIEAPTKNKNVEISDFGFAPEYTGQGLGTLFLPHMISAAFEVNPQIKEIILSTRSTNHIKVPAFYTNFGFEITHTEDAKE